MKFRLLALAILAAAVLLPVEASAASSSTALTFASIGTYKYYKLECSGITGSVAAPGVRLDLQFSNSGTFATTGYSWSRQYIADDATPTVLSQSSGSTSITSAIPLVGTLDVDTSAVSVALGNLSLASGHKSARFHGSNFDGTNNITVSGAGRYGGTTSAVDGVRVIPSSGTIVSGQCTLYGLNS
jgi:hypothetical protein